MASTRRTVLKIAGGAVGAGAAVMAGSLAWLTAKSREDPLNYAFPDTQPVVSLPPTSACGHPAATVAQTEGPFYTPETPMRANFLEPGISGQRLVFEGRVLTTGCQPVAGAVLDVWSCDGEGVYDNDGFRLRGHVFTDAQGRFRIETIRPSYYEGFGFLRTAHLHVKLQGRATRLLTTQMYFPGDPHNAEDSIFDESLLMAVEEQGDGSLRGSFDFVLEPVLPG